MEVMVRLNKISVTNITTGKMKKIKILFLALIAITATSCIKNDPILITETTDAVLEWDAATYNSKAAGVNYPLLTRLPGFGRAVSTSVDPVITRASGTVKLRINLVGAPRSTPVAIKYGVVTTGTTAVAGTHFNITGTATVAPNTNYADVEVQILNPGVSSTTARDLILQILDTSELRVNPNYNQIGLRISQN